jgi:hypothetical protein
MATDEYQTAITQIQRDLLSGKLPVADAFFAALREERDAAVARAEQAEENLRKTVASYEGDQLEALGQLPPNTLYVTDGDVVLLPGGDGSVGRVTEIEELLGCETAILPNITVPWVLRQVVAEDADLTTAPQVGQCPRTYSEGPDVDVERCTFDAGHRGAHSWVG